MRYLESQTLDEDEMAVTKVSQFNKFRLVNVLVLGDNEMTSLLLVVTCSVVSHHCQTSVRHADIAQADIKIWKIQPDTSCLHPLKIAYSMHSHFISYNVYPKYLHL